MLYQKSFTTSFLRFSLQKERKKLLIFCYGGLIITNIKKKNLAINDTGFERQF